MHRTCSSSGDLKDLLHDLSESETIKDDSGCAMSGSDSYNSLKDFFTTPLDNSIYPIQENEKER